MYISAETLKISETVTIKNKTYTVLAIHPIDAVKFPRRAIYVSATVYLQIGNRGNVYSLPIDVCGTYNTKISPLNCGVWNKEDIAKIQTANIK